MLLYKLCHDGTRLPVSLLMSASSKFESFSTSGSVIKQFKQDPLSIHWMSSYICGYRASPLGYGYNTLNQSTNYDEGSNFMITSTPLIASKFCCAIYIEHHQCQASCNLLMMSKLSSIFNNLHQQLTLQKTFHPLFSY